jgi:hypothetical protein
MRLRGVKHTKEKDMREAKGKVYDVEVLLVF